MPKHLVVSNVIDHLAQKNLLKRILDDDERTTSRAIKELMSAMRRIHSEAAGWGLEVTFVGPPGFQTWPRSLQVAMLCLKETAKKIGVHFTYGACSLRIHDQTLRLMEPAHPAFFAVMSRLVQNHPKIQTEGYRQTLNLTIDDAMCYSHG